MRENIIKNKSFDFAVSIVKLTRRVANQEKEFILTKQLMRSGTSIGALVRESEFAESKKDFIHKLHIALKEANESEYWLNLMAECQIIDKTTYNTTKPSSTELIRILTSIINTSKSNLS